jgi:hypothetical protein
MKHTEDVRCSHTSGAGRRSDTGRTAEGIAQAFPTLTLEQAYGAITFYLAHRAEIDEHLERSREEFGGRELRLHRGACAAVRRP